MRCITGSGGVSLLEAWKRVVILEARISHEEDDR
jgi:hypothetical protein